MTINQVNVKYHIHQGLISCDSLVDINTKTNTPLVVAVKVMDFCCTTTFINAHHIGDFEI